MHNSAPLATTADLIAAASEHLTPTDRRVAEAVLAEPTLLAFGTVSELADHVGTSRPSIVRFAHRLGFAGYSELQEHVRSRLSQRMSRPSDRIRQNDPGTLSAKEALEGAIASVLEASEGNRLATLAEPLTRANTVWIVSGETSRAGAHALYNRLKIVRPGVVLLDGHSLGADLSSAGPGDAAVIFDFARYRKQAIRTANILKELGVEIVAITDGALSPLAALTNNWCEITIPAIGPFDSSVPAVAMAELLVSRVAGNLKDKARSRIDLIEELWKATETFVEQT